MPRPYETLDRAAAPEGRELTLLRHDREYAIHLDGEELMSSRAPGSESALGRLACESASDERHPRVLIGGLGLGFTLRAALDCLPAGAEVVVAELLEAVVDWNRERLAELAARPLDDPRVRVRITDVFALLAESPESSWSSIALDVDNGPSFFCLDANARLYDRRGLDIVHRALRPGGCLAVWSSYEDPRFVRQLQRAGFEARAKGVRSRGRKGQRHTIFLARRRERPVHRARRTDRRRRS
jgi:spermidine synthase